MSVLLDVLLTEQLEAAFRTAREKTPSLNAVLVAHPSEEAGQPAGRGTAVRISTTSGDTLLVTARRIAREVGPERADLVVFSELVGYDWISREMAEKVRLEDEHYDRLYLHVTGARDVVLEHLGPAVYPLMAYLGKVLELRSQKVLLPRIGEDVLDVVSRCLRAAVEGPFFTDGELGELMEQDRASLRVVAVMWQRMNLASPELRRTLEGVMEMLLQRRHAHPAEWAIHVGVPPERVEAALETVRRVTESDG